jgi:hypothetical protein
MTVGTILGATESIGCRQMSEDINDLSQLQKSPTNFTTPSNYLLFNLINHLTKLLHLTVLLNSLIIYLSNIKLIYLNLTYHLISALHFLSHVYCVLLHFTQPILYIKTILIPLLCTY